MTSTPTSNPPATQPQIRREVPSEAQRSLGLWVQAIGSFAIKPAQWQIAERRLPCYAASYVRSGGGWFESSVSGRIEVPADGLIWMFPNVPHSYAPERWWSEDWVFFGGAVPEAFERAGFLSRRHPVVALRGDSEVPRLFAEIFRAMQASSPLRCVTAGARVHELLVAAHAAACGLDAKHGDATIRAALEWMDADDGYTLTPEGLASKIGVGYSTLRRRFRHATGYSVKEYLLRGQLQRAQELLTYSRLPIEEIAARCGFRDPLYFSRIFRSRFGLPPSQFRANLESGPASMSMAIRAHR